MDFSTQLFFSLEGKWAFNRSINGSEIMRGTALFHSVNECLPSYSYQEEGIYSAGPLSQLSFFREYFYCLNNKTIEVYFSFQKKKHNFFYALAFSCPNLANGVHHCVHDVYKATYVFLEKDIFLLQYDVRGPKKDFVIQTTFTRLHNNIEGGG
ncbi:MAG: hypothetical protein JSR85_05870 [Proteobacteria bacterium]|nr:hypothetical protein [Pseudomonadota bacterium]